jgi:phage tail protein X
MQTVKTIQGDTWDAIALRVYGNVLRAQDLMAARENVRLLDYQIFPGGVTVATPEIEEGTATDDMPEWRK